MRTNISEKRKIGKKESYAAVPLNKKIPEIGLKIFYVPPSALPARVAAYYYLYLYFEN